LLQPLIQAANRSDDGSGVNCHEWTEERKEEFREKGMMEVYQEKGETIFMYVSPLLFASRSNKADV